MTNENNIALVDMDGTLCDYEGAMKAKLRECLPTFPDYARQPDNYKVLVSELKKVPGFWKNLQRIELGFEIIELLKSNGFNLHVLTKGPHNTTSAWSEKIEWCREHLPGIPVTITEDKSLVYGKILVDDWPSYIKSWLAWRPRGIVIMPAHDYNVGLDTQYPKQIIRVTKDNLQDVDLLVKKISLRKPGEEL